MTDKEIKSLIESRWNDWKYGSSTEAKYKAEECKDILELIDSLQEEPVSESIDFEQELYKAFGQIKDFTLGIAIAKRFYDMGRKHAEKQMMAKAVDARCFGFQGAALFSFRLPADKYLVGSEVKVVVIKEE